MKNHSFAFDASGAQNFLDTTDWATIQPEVEAAAALLESRKGPGNEFLGWLDLPDHYDQAELDRVKAAAQRIRETSEVLVVIGIGGSYLGAKAALDFCGHHFYNQIGPNARAKSGGKAPEIYFAGHQLSAAYLLDLIDLIGDRDFSVNVISKSGTTTEPAVAFRLFKRLLEQRYGREGAQQRIYATTDKARGALKQLATQEGYETFVVPDDVGGRFSVLTPVGLLPIAAAGIDVDALLEGAAAAKAASFAPFAENACMQYAAARNLLHRKGKLIELLVGYEPRCHYISEWWKQLYGESEGKGGKGIFPASVDFTTDLHSMGQYVQDGPRHLFETVLDVKDAGRDIEMHAELEDLDGLNYLTGKKVSYINQQAAEGTRMAHLDGQVPNLRIHLPDMGPHTLGSLFFFFEKACAISGYVLGVNPFDQPGVEAYKKNMFALLGKQG